MTRPARSLPRTTLAQKMDVISSQANIAGYESVVVSEGGRWAAVLHFEESGPQQRRIQGYLVDLQSKAVEALPVPDATLGFHPSSEMLHVDAARSTLFSRFVGR